MLVTFATVCLLWDPQHLSAEGRAALTRLLAKQWTRIADAEGGIVAVDCGSTGPCGIRGRLHS